MNPPGPVVMFLSIDLVGSTNFKAAHDAIRGPGGWTPAFEAFFAELPLVLLGELAMACEDQENLVDVWVWKVIGDEIVFAAYPDCPEDALAVARAFYRAVVRFDASFSARWPLRVRGCCWGARLDIRNRHILIPEMRPRVEGQAFDDFLGPDVDIGYRIQGCVGRGQVIMSSNLAESLASLDSLGGFEFHLVGRQVLKGVYGGRPYPIILVTDAGAPPDFWEWEPDEDKGLAQLRANQPMPPAALILQLQRIREHLRHMHGVDTGPPLFGI